MTLRILLILLLTLLPAAPPASAQEPAAPDCMASRLCIGVRSHARPFSYRVEGDARTDASSGPLSAAKYTGYMIRICDAVLQEMILDDDLRKADIGIFDIDADAAGTQAGGTTGSRLDLLGEKFDILCDPATITNDRRNGYVVSPPLYLTGISFIVSKGTPLERDLCGMFRATAGRKKTGLIGVVGGTTAASEGVEALVRAGVLPALEGNLNNYLAGRDLCEGAVTSDQFVMAFDTHEQAARAFCGGDPERGFLFYVGDLEIITENALANKGCGFDGGTQTFTNDRYAIFAKSYSDAVQAGRARLIARFYEILAQKVVFSPSLLDQAFKDTFISQTPSRKLEVFFWSIRGEVR